LKFEDKCFAATAQGMNAKLLHGTKRAFPLGNCNQSSETREDIFQVVGGLERCGSARIPRTKKAGHLGCGSKSFSSFDQEKSSQAKARAVFSLSVANCLERATMVTRRYIRRRVFYLRLLCAVQGCAQR
jgi:hypothetical protein